MVELSANNCLSSTFLSVVRCTYDCEFKKKYCGFPLY